MVNILPKSHKEHKIQFQRKVLRRECTAKKPTSSFQKCVEMRCTFQICNIQKVEIVDKELERNPSFYQKEILLREKFSSWMAPQSPERKYKELRKEIREILANIKFKFQTLPKCPFVTAAACTGHRSQNYHKILRALRFPSKEQGHILGAQESGVPFRFDLPFIETVT